MSKAFCNLLSHIDKLSHTQKEQVNHWVKRYVEPSSSVGGRLINEMRETRHYRIKSNGGNHVIKGLYHIRNVNELHFG